ncbi:MAG: PAS domain S-box protein [Polyangiaceae bacterium]|nr:PAS domain S-box protein [Polyangiaceae bacterium]
MPATPLLLALGRRIASMIPAEELPPDLVARCEIEPLDLARLDEIQAPLVAAVLDAGRATTDELVEACGSAILADTPRLVVCPAARVDEVQRALPESEIVTRPLGAREAHDLGRRLSLLVDLGVARLSLRLYEQAMDEGVTGLTIAHSRGGALSILHASESFERLTGHSAAAAVGRDFRFLQADDADPGARETLRRAVQARTRGRAVIRNARGDGARFWNEVTVFPLQAQGQALPLFGGVQHDVTELVEARERVERLVAEQVERVAFDQAVLDALEVAVMTVDEAGRITFANRAARELLEQDQLEGAQIHEALALRSDPWSLLVEGSKHLSHQLHGRELAITVTRLPCSTLAGLAGLVIAADVTGEKQLQGELRRVERLAAMGTMVAGFAHEVRNPVASLRAMAEQLDEDLAEIGVSMPHAARMLKVLGRVEALVDSSLRFGRPSPPRRAEHRPWQILSSALAAVLPRTRAMGEEIRVEVEPDLPSVFVDEGQIVQVLVIFLDNALDATQSPRRVLLRALGRRLERRGSEPPPGVRFEVTDDGPGVSASVVERIFDPFFTTKPSGTGLGLSIAQQLARENGGRIDVSSAPGGTTTFAVHLDPAPPPDSTRGS